MAEAAISWSVTLVVNLVDASDGKSIQGSDVRFFRNGEMIRLMNKGEAGFVLFNEAKENFSLKVSVRNFDETEMNIDFEKLDKNPPKVTIFLLPSISQDVGNNVISFTGILPGIEAIEAVTTGPAYCFAKEFNEKKKTLTLWNPHRLNLRDEYYGIRGKEGKDYVPVRILKNLRDESVVIDRSIDMTQLDNGPISRIIFGKTRPDGTYILRVRDNGSSQKYIVRYVVNGEERFAVADFNDPETGGLK